MDTKISSGKTLGQAAKQLLDSSGSMQQIKEALDVAYQATIKLNSDRQVDPRKLQEPFTL